MKRKHFSSFLLMGKVATLPLLIQSARADLTSVIGGATTSDASLQYTDITTSKLSILALPVDGQVKLKNTVADAATAYSSASAYASELLCPSSSNALPTKMSIVVTGVKAGDWVYLLGAKTKNDPQNMALNSKITVGGSGLVVLGFANLTGTSGATSAVTIPVDLTATGNKELVAAGSFYVQAATTSDPRAPISQWQISELDMVSVGTQQHDSYGNVTGYCV